MPKTKEQILGSIFRRVPGWLDIRKTKDNFSTATPYRKIRILFAALNWPQPLRFFYSISEA